MKHALPLCPVDPATIIRPTDAFAVRAGFADWEAVAEALRRHQRVVGPYVGVVATSSKSMYGQAAFQEALDALRNEMPDLSLTIDELGVALLARTSCVRN